MSGTAGTKFNVMTVLNSDYFEFGKVFVNSFHDKVDHARVNRLYIYDTGLSDENRKYLSVFPSVEVVSTQLNTRHLMLHDEDWRKNVYSKTAFLLQVVEKDRLPTVMIDSDCLFLADFFDLIPADHDFVVCRREGQTGFSQYIASFFVINAVDKAADMIRDWRNEMFFGTENHKESPALSRVVMQGRHDFVDIEEDRVSYVGSDITSDVKIVHMKSTRELQTVAQRIGQACLRPFTNRYCTAIPLPVQGSAREAEFAVITSADTAVSKAEQLRAITPMQRALLLKRLHKGER